MRTFAALLLAGLATLAMGSASGSDAAPAGQRVKHVFVITLENKNYDTTWGPGTQAVYLNGELKAKGVFLTRYYATGHASLDNYISMISGQPSSPDTQSDCPFFNEFKQTGTSPEGLPVGNGCVYPAGVKTLANQLSDMKLSWKGYMQDMGNDPARDSATCSHPALNARDLTQSAQAPSAAVPAGDQYATRHNPFMYFHSHIDAPDCAAHVVALDKLDADLAAVATTPNFSFITPNLCMDGHDGDGTGKPGKTCVNGAPGGLTSSDEFLKVWVPKILASPAFKKDGLLIVTFDESNTYSVSRATDAGTGIVTTTAKFKGETCCNQQPGPNVTRPATIDFPISGKRRYRMVLEGVGGDRIGAVLISPFIKPGTVSDTPYNHYSLLKSLEDIFGTKGYLGFARQPGLVSFGKDVFNN